MTNVRGRHRAERGVGKLVLLVFGTLLAVVAFVAYHVLPFYYYYFELQEQMQQLVRVGSVDSDKELRAKLAAHLKRMEIPAEIDDVKIERAGDRVAISLDYDEVFYVTWHGKDYTLRVFHFHAYAEGEGDGG